LIRVVTTSEGSGGGVDEGGEWRGGVLEAGRPGQYFIIAALEASSGLPAEAGALVLSAAKAAAELHAFRRDTGAGAEERPEEPSKKRKTSGTRV